MGGPFLAIARMIRAALLISEAIRNQASKFLARLSRFEIYNEMVFITQSTAAIAEDSSMHG